MVETVTARASHYDVLGVKPDASNEEIARAFAREMGRPRAFGGLADVSIAYEVLRNPERRRAYDQAMGIVAEPEPPLAPEPFRRPMALHARPQFIASPAASSLSKPVIAPVKDEQVENPAEPVLPPFIARAMEELAAPAPLAPRAKVRPEPLPQSAPAVAPRAERRPEPKPEAFAPIPRVVIEPMFGEEGTPQWKKVAVPAGVAVLAMALLGAWAGWNSSSDPAPGPSAETALLSPPPATTYSVNDPVEKTAEAPVLDESPAITAPLPAPRPADRRTARRRAAAPPSGLAEVEQQLTESPAAQVPEPAESLDATPKPVAASMPLPNSVVARTIARIGYPCGSVASTTAAGSPGVFTVTCTSGHSYKAAPVRGRYHFSRVRN